MFSPQFRKHVQETRHRTMNSRAWHESTPDGGASGGTAGAELLRLARGSIEHGLAHREPLPLNCEELPRVLTEPAATFTTLHLAGKLRGCCGTLEAARPLGEDVAYSAFRAAFRCRSTAPRPMVRSAPTSSFRSSPK